MLPVLLLGLGLFLVGLFSLWERGARRTRLRRTPTTPAARARPGDRVKVVGRLTVRAPVHAPFSDRDCAYFRLRVTQRDDSDRNRDEPGLQYEQVEYAEDWAVEDASGRLALDPTEATLVGVQVREYVPGSAFNAFEPPRDVLLRYISSAREGMGQQTSFREERLDVGVRLIVVGRVEAGPQGPVLVGGRELEIYEGFEQENLQYRPVDYLYMLLVVVGLLLSVAAVLDTAQEPPLPAEMSPVTPLRPVPSDTSRP